MLYITIDEIEKDAANEFIRRKIDYTAGDTFIVNKKKSNGNCFCVVSIPDDDKIFAKKMKNKFDAKITKQLPASLLDIE